jgi:hypothetical protein
MVRFLPRVVDEIGEAQQLPILLEGALRRAFVACNELLPFSPDNLEVGYLLLIVKAVAGERGQQLVRSRLREADFAGSQSAHLSNHDVLRCQDFLEVTRGTLRPHAGEVWAGLAFVRGVCTVYAAAANTGGSVTRLGFEDAISQLASSADEVKITRSLLHPLPRHPAFAAPSPLPPPGQPLQQASFFTSLS